MRSNPDFDQASARNGKKARVRPTDRQIAAMHSMNTDDLVEIALVAMHSLNRRAKEMRDRRNRYRGATFVDAVEADIKLIYSLKDKFCDALVRSGRATVEVFTHRRERASWWYCSLCDREWAGFDPQCFCCGNDGEGEAVVEEVEWFVIDTGRFRWHQPGSSVSAAVRQMADPCKAHDPYQPAKEIPPAEVALPGLGAVRLTIEAQKNAVGLATQRLLEEVAGRPTTAT